MAINSIPQQEVANGKGQSELARANPTTSFSVVAKKPSPETPSGGATIFIFESLILILDFRSGILDLKKLKNQINLKNHYLSIREIINRKSQIVN